MPSSSTKGIMLWAVESDVVKEVPGVVVTPIPDTEIVPNPPTTLWPPAAGAPAAVASAISVGSAPASIKACSSSASNSAADRSGSATSKELSGNLSETAKISSPNLNALFRPTSTREPSGSSKVTEDCESVMISEPNNTLLSSSNSETLP